MVRRLAFWVGQDVDVAEFVRSCQTRQRTKAEHGGPQGLAGRVVRIAPNRAAAPRDSRFGQNERLGDSAIRRFGSS